jgi:hypothetical protein
VADTVWSLSRILSVSQSTCPTDASHLATSTSQPACRHVHAACLGACFHVTHSL